MKARLMDTGLHADKAFRVKYVDEFYLNSTFHFHNACEMVLIEEGYGKRIVGDHVEDFDSGDLVLMGPNLPHIWQTDNVFLQKKKNVRVRSTVIYFAPAVVLNLIAGTEAANDVEQLFAKASRGLRIKSSTHRLLLQKIAEINQTEGLKKVAVFLEMIDLLSHSADYDFLASSTYRNAMSTKDTGRFNDVYQFLITNFHREIPLEEIAGVAKMSPTAFCRYFKARTQKSFVRFLLEIRISHACKLLRGNERSIMEIGMDSGYNNLVHFNKCFKSVTDMSPSEYRKHLRMEAIPG